MNRTRVVAVVSAILGSTAGCLVLSRWRLAGTITGAVVVPVIYTLVSHCSTESLDRLGKWARRLVHRGKPHTELPEAETAPRVKTVSIEEAPDAETARTPAPRAAGARLQWSLVAFAFLAFATSVYSLVQAEPAQQTIVREKVIENRIVQKTVTVTSPASLTSSAAAAVSGTSSTTLPAEGAGDGQDAGGGVVTTSSTTTTLAPGPTY